MDQQYHSNEEMISHLKESGVLVSQEVENALRNVLREDFVTEEKKEIAYYDKPISYKGSRSWATPTRITSMLEILQVRKGDKILEIGTSAGWRTALLAYLAGPSGEIYTYEIKPELSEFAQSNLSKYPDLAKNITWIIGDATLKAKDHAPYGRILSAAAFKDIKDDMLQLLGERGRMILPTQNKTVHLFVRFEADIQETLLPGYTFTNIEH